MSEQEQKLTILEESLEEIKQMKIVRFFDKLLESKYGLYALPVIVLIDVYLLILPLEPILAVYAIKHKKVPLWVITTIAVVVSLFGYLSLYLIGYHFSEPAIGLFGKIFNPEQVAATGVLLDKNIMFLSKEVNVAALFGFTSALASIPIPLSVFTFSVGVFKVSVIPFTIMFMVGRYVRYYISAWVGRTYGIAALEAVFKNVFFFTLLLVVSLALLIYKIF